MNFILCLFLICPSLYATNLPIYDCDDWFAVQKQLETAARSYDLHSVSLLRASSSERLNTIKSLQENSAVLSLGSGPDIFRPLVDFPFVDEIHLVDTLTGWGAGPGEVIFELKRRIKSLHPTMQIKILQDGFTGKIEQQRETFSFPIEYWEKWEKRSSYRTPLVLEMTWQGPRGDFLSKVVFLHPKDFNNTIHVDELFSSLKEKNLAGILITGTYAPADIEQYVSRLSSQRGLVLFEDFVKAGVEDPVHQKFKALGLVPQEIPGESHFIESFKRYSNNQIDLKTFIYSKK